MDSVYVNVCTYSLLKVKGAYILSLLTPPLYIKKLYGNTGIAYQVSLRFIDSIGTLISNVAFIVCDLFSLVQDTGEHASHGGDFIFILMC